MSTNKITSISVLWKLALSDKYTNTNNNDNIRSSGATLPYENMSTNKITSNSVLWKLELCDKFTNANNNDNARSSGEPDLNINS